MKIKVAETAGFCWGVRRAIDKVLKLREETSGKIQTFGPLIHNPQAMQSLEQRGISTADTLEELDAPTVVIRTHGIAPVTRRELQKRAENICDGTCPRVGLIHSLIKRSVRDGKTVIIAGDPGHAEVIGLSGYAGERGYVVSSAAEAEQLPEFDDVVVVAQTTFSEAEYNKITDVVRERFPSAEVHDTICDSTHNRQAEVAALARASDAVIIIGGHNSANTNRLAELSASLGTPTHHIETDEELSPEMLEGVETVGISAGASTPHWMIQRVVERLELIGTARTASLPKLIARFLIASNIYVSVGAGLLCLLTTAMLGIAPLPHYLLIAGFYIFSMHLLSHFADKTAVGHNEPMRFRLYYRYRLAMTITGIITAAGALSLAFLLGILPGMLVLLATLTGLLYSVRIIPRRWKRALKFRRLKDIPSSKDVFVGIAWSAVTVLVPAFHAGLPLFSMTVFTPLLGVFALVYARSVLFDIREIGGDRIVGKESLATLLGGSHSQLLLALLISAAMLWFLVSPAAGLAPHSGFLLLPPLLYLGALLLSFRIFTQPGTAANDKNGLQPARRWPGLAVEAMIDFVFIFAGLLGILAMW